MTYKKKLIEVALPLDAINREAARQKTMGQAPASAESPPVVGSAAPRSDASRPLGIFGG